MRNSHYQYLAITLILLAYLVIGGLYAALTPDWQVPDEPAHYNYVQQLANGTLPVIEPGDYDQDFLDKLKASGFPPNESISTIQYEDHQPPLYYLLASPIFLLYDGDLLPLRLFSLMLGAMTLFVAWKIGRLIFPTRPLVVLMAVALIAFIPQHLAMMAGVNNDSLAELLLAIALLGAVQVLVAERPPTPWALGLLLGAIFVTKSQAYIAAPVLAVALAIRWRRERREAGWLLRYAAGLLAPALLLGVLWWGRNIATYGGVDWMGLSQHDLVVTGQPTTADWIAEYGLPATLRRFFQFTFQSFWGMFGWMAVPMNARSYQGVGIWSALTAVGFGLALAGRRGQGPRGGSGRAIALVLTFSATLSALGYLWWNVSFVQHQGRYLYPALIPLGLAAGIAWEHLAYDRTAQGVAGFCLLVSIGLFTTGQRFFALLVAGAAGLLWLNSRLSIRFRWLLPALASAGLAGLALLSLFLFVIPWLN